MLLLLAVVGPRVASRTPARSHLGVCHIPVAAVWWNTDAWGAVPDLPVGPLLHAALADSWCVVHF